MDGGPSNLCISIYTVVIILFLHHNKWPAQVQRNFSFTYYASENGMGMNQNTIFEFYKGMYFT